MAVITHQLQQPDIFCNQSIATSSVPKTSAEGRLWQVGQTSGRLLARQRLGQMFRNGICRAVELPLIDRSSEYVTFISETRARAIYGNGAKILTDLRQGNYQRKFYTLGMLPWRM